MRLAAWTARCFVRWANESLERQLRDRDRRIEDLTEKNAALERHSLWLTELLETQHKWLEKTNVVLGIQSRE